MLSISTTTGEGAPSRLESLKQPTRRKVTQAVDGSSKDKVEVVFRGKTAGRM